LGRCLYQPILMVVFCGVGGCGVLVLVFWVLVCGLWFGVYLGFFGFCVLCGCFGLLFWVLVGLVVVFRALRLIFGSARE